MHSIQNDNFYLYRHVIHACYNVYPATRRIHKTKQFYTCVFVCPCEETETRAYICYMFGSVRLGLQHWFHTPLLYVPTQENERHVDVFYWVSNVPLFFRLEYYTVLLSVVFFLSSSFIKLRLFKCCICLCHDRSLFECMGYLLKSGR